MSKITETNNLKKFFIKLISITLAIIIAFNIIFNLIFADKLENLSQILSLDKKENIDQVKNKLRSEIKKGLDKDYILNKEDKILLYKFYIKIKNEFKEIEKN